MMSQGLCWMRERHTQHSEKVNVWAGIVGDQVIEPIFFQINLNEVGYLEFLQEELVLDLAILFPNPDEADVPNRNIWFQQDGAPPFARPAREYPMMMYFQADELVEEDALNAL